MSTNSSNLVLISAGLLSAFGLDPETFCGRAAEWDNVREVRPVSRWTKEEIGPLFPGANLILAGRRDPLPNIEGVNQYPLDLAALMGWLDGDARENIEALLKAALAGIEPLPSPSEEVFEPERRVLVYGYGQAAEKAVSALAEAGHSVCWASTNGQVPGDIETLYADLEDIKGFAGRFTVRLKNEGETRDIAAGAVVLAGPENRRAAFAFSGAGSWTAIEGGTNRSEWPEGFKVAFLCGPAVSTNNMARILETALDIESNTQASVYVLSPHVKVAGQGLEILYGQAREVGVTFLRTSDDGPEIEAAENGQVTFRLFDPVCRARVKLTPDRVVVDESLIPSEYLEELAGRLGLAMGPDGYLTPDNVLFMPSLSGRRGIYVLGPARGTDSAEGLTAEINGILADIALLFAKDRLPAAQVIVDEEKCASCLTCFRGCPHGAIRFTTRPWPDPLACQACGICVALCPAKALTLTGYTDSQAELVNRIMLARARSENYGFVPRLVVFGCRRSALPALLAAPKPDSPMDLVLTALPCGGRLDDRTVLKAFMGGADGVMIAVCHDDNCRTQEGNRKAAARNAYLMELLDSVGFEPARLTFFSLAPNQGLQFTKAASEFNARIRELGPSPFRRPHD